MLASADAAKRPDRHRRPVHRPPPRHRPVALPRRSGARRSRPPPGRRGAGRARPPVAPPAARRRLRAAAGRPRADLRLHGRRGRRRVRVLVPDHTGPVAVSHLMRRFLDYYRQFEELSPEEISRDLIERRHAERAEALTEVVPLDLTSAAWHEPPDPEAVNAATYALRRALHTYPDPEPLREAIAPPPGG